MFYLDRLQQPDNKTYDSQYRLKILTSSLSFSTFKLANHDLFTLIKE